MTLKKQIFDGFIVVIKTTLFILSQIRLKVPCLKRLRLFIIFFFLIKPLTINSFHLCNLSPTKDLQKDKIYIRLNDAHLNATLPNVPTKISLEKVNF
jgi:hypothetical protein